MSEYKLVKNSNYSFTRAEEDVWYTLWRKTKNWRGNEKWEQIKQYHPFELPIPVIGDLKWAKKIAKDLNIEVPK